MHMEPQGSTTAVWGKVMHYTCAACLPGFELSQRCYYDAGR